MKGEIEETNDKPYLRSDGSETSEKLLQIPRMIKNAYLSRGCLPCSRFLDTDKARKKTKTLNTKDSLLHHHKNLQNNLFFFT